MLITWKRAHLVPKSSAVDFWCQLFVLFSLCFVWFFPHPDSPVPSFAPYARAITYDSHRFSKGHVCVINHSILARSFPLAISYQVRDLGEGGDWEQNDSSKHMFILAFLSKWGAGRRRGTMHFEVPRSSRRHRVPFLSLGPTAPSLGSSVNNICSAEEAVKLS